MSSMDSENGKGEDDQEDMDVSSSEEEDEKDWRTMNRKEVELQLEKNPIDNHMRFRLAEILIEQGKDIEMARKLIESIRLSNKKFMKAECLELLGDIENLDSIRNYEEAIRLYCESRNKDENIRINIKLGKTHEKMRHFDEAIVYLKNAIWRDPLCFEAHYRMGICLIRNNQRREGIESLKKALKIKPNDIDTLIKLCEIYFNKENNVSLAESMMQQVLKQNDQLPEALILHGRIYEKKGDNDRALEIFQKALEIADKNKEDRKSNLLAHFFIGCQFERQGKIEKSIAHFKQCLLYDQTHFGACIHLATQYSSLGDLQKGQKYFSHCIKLNPISVPAHFGLGKILHEFGKTQEALKHYRFVIQNDPNHYRAYCQIGLIYLERQDLENAADFLKKCLKLNGKYPPGMIALGNLLFESGHAKSASHYFEQALKFNNRDLQALIGLANTCYDMGQPQEAIKYYNLAIEIDDEIADVYYNLGNAHYLLKNIPDAI